MQSANWFLSDAKRDGARTSDITAGAIVALIFLGHVVLILGGNGPYWNICCGVPIAPYLWSTLAIGLAVSLIVVAVQGESTRRRRVMRAGLGAILLLFAADSLTGGDRRWLEVEMRWQMRKCGGPEGLQAWAQSVLSSPEKLASVDQAEAKLPPGIQKFADATCGFHHPLYIGGDGDGPYFLFGTGRELGWGVLVGKQDLTNPSPVAGSHAGWTKRLIPGLYLYMR